MALRIPGRGGNFKPKPKPVLRRPPAASQPSAGARTPGTPATPVTPATTASQSDSASAPPSAPPSTAPELSTPVTSTPILPPPPPTPPVPVVAASPVVAQPPLLTPQSPEVPKVAAPKPKAPVMAPPRSPVVAAKISAAPPAVAAVPPAVASAPAPPTPAPTAPAPTPSAPKLRPAAIITKLGPDDVRKEREDSVVSEYPPPTPGGSSQPTTPRGPRKAKPLLAAAAASKTPTQRGTLREREKLKQKERAEREKEKLAQTPTSMRFTPSHSPAPGTPTASWFPPAVSTPRSELGMPPSVVSSDFPPSVASTAPVAQDDPASSGSTPDPAALAAALATIREDPAEASTSTAARKRQPRKKAVTTAAATADVDMDEAPSSPKRRRQSRPRQSRAGPIRADGEGEDEGESDVSDLADEDYVESGSDGGGGDASKAKRARRGTYKSAGRAGTTKDRRTSAFRRQATIAAPELTGVQANELVGEEVNPAIIRLGDLATSLAAQGRVSARTIKLANFQRSEEERKLRERATKTENNWRRRQIVRRKARELRNAKRAERREAVAAAGENEGAISDDEPDSEEDYEIEPDRLTPPGSPRKADRVAPVSFEPLPVVAAEGEEGEGSGSGAVRAPHGDVEFEDIEGLGFVHQPGGEEDEEMGETLEDFQLPVEDDGEPEAPHDPEAGMDISGLEANDYSGGYLDDEGNWVEGGTMNRAALLHQRNEEHRRRILDGDHGQTVEVIDNETQFVNSATWGKKVSNDRWTAEETELFFAVLRETGENYTLMKAYFPGRSVRQLKNKGSRENRVNTQRMTDAIMNRKPMDKKYLAKSSGFNADKPYDRENAFLDEVAREKERVIAGLEPLPALDDELAVQDASGWDPLEFGQELVEPTTS